MAVQHSNLLGVVVVVISDDAHGESQLDEALGALGCVIVHPEPNLELGGSLGAEVGVVDVRRQSGWCVAAIAALRTAEPACATLSLLGTGGSEDVARSLHAGAVDCMLKPVDLDELLEGVENAVACTRRWRRRIALDSLSASTLLTPKLLTPKLLTPKSKKGRPAGSRSGSPIETRPIGDGRVDALIGRLAIEHNLTIRERQVLYFLLQGHRYDDIGVALGVSPRTAKFHAANVLRKLDLDSRYDLPRLLVGLGN